MQAGEWHLLEFLADVLDDSFEVYFNPFLNGDRPDVVILRKGGGVLIIEVKDWHLDHYRIDAQRRWRTRHLPEYVRSPLEQVLHYKKNLYELHIEGLLEKKIRNFRYNSLVQCAVYFHCETRDRLQALLVKPFAQDTAFQKQLRYHLHLIGKDDLTPACFTGLLRQTNLIFDSGGSRYFTDDLYESFRRHLYPIGATLKKKAYLTYTKEQQKFIHSQPGQVLVKGVAGSGKTTVLAARAVSAYQRINRLGVNDPVAHCLAANSLAAESERVLVLTYNLSLCNYIREKIEQLPGVENSSGFYITSYHKFIHAAMNGLGMEMHLPDDFETSRTQEEQQRYLAEQFYDNAWLFENHKALIRPYRVILIDEVQDYKLQWLELIKKYFLAADGEYVLFGDEYQNIYHNPMETDREIRTNLSDKRKRYKLSKDLRSQGPVGALAADFQKLCLHQKYNSDQAAQPVEPQLGLISKLIYHTYAKAPAIDELAASISRTLNQAGIPSGEAVVLGASTEFLRRLDCAYRLLTREKTQTVFETQEVYCKLLVDKLHFLSSPTVLAGLDLIPFPSVPGNTSAGSLSESELCEEQRQRLASLISIRQLCKPSKADKMPDGHLRQVYEQKLARYSVSPRQFEDWYQSQSWQTLLEQSRGYVSRMDLQKIRTHKKAHFWDNRGLLKLSTVHSFKGWEAHTVFVVIQDRQLCNDELIYSALTRSKSNLIVYNLGNDYYDFSLRKVFEQRGVIQEGVIYGR